LTLSAGQQVLDLGEFATIEDSYFTDNLPIKWRGQIEIKRSWFTNNGNDQTMGGGLWIEGQAKIEKTTFSNNQASSGGAIYLKSGSLEVRRGKFRGNQAKEFGGAINVVPPGPAQPGSILKLSYSHFEQNHARDGGAISFWGEMSDEPYKKQTMYGALIRFANNVAESDGGAIAVGDARIALSRSLFVGNTARGEGGAVSAKGFGWTSARFGNILMVRNVAQKGGGYFGGPVDVVNSTLADNVGGGIRLRAPPFFRSRPSLTIRNTIVLNNGRNCPDPEDNALVVDLGENIQFPGDDCGATITQADPALDSMYVPAMGSPARFAGDNKTCIEHELVAAKDVFGDSRPTGPRCTIGAIERDAERHALHALRSNREMSTSPLWCYLSILGVERFRCNGRAAQGEKSEAR
jgi:predicted outer membrane repeat protein